MDLLLFALLFAAALSGTAIMLRVAMTRSSQSAVQFATVISGGVALLWLLITVSAFELTTVSGGSEFSYSYPSLSAVGVIGVGLSLLVLYKGAVESLGQ